MSTVFKKIIDREIPADIVYEDDEILAFKDIYPVAPVHIVFIPKKEIKNLSYTTDEDALLLGKIQIAIAKVAKKLNLENGYRVVTNIGEDGGQTVLHLHYHLIGGKKLGIKLD